MGGYFKDLSDTIVSTLKGMSVTLKHLFSKPVTVHYPDESMPIADAYRGKHLLIQDGCRACLLCSKACPVDCIDLAFERHMKRVIEWEQFDIDYNRCVFCGLCTEACPTEVLKMTAEYDLSTDDRRTIIKDLLEWRGLRPEDHENIRLLKEKAEADKKKKAEEAAKAAAEGGAAEGEAKPKPKPKPKPKAKEAEDAKESGSAAENDKQDGKKE